MKKNQSYKSMKYSDLVSRRDFGKIHTDFEEPHLLEMQKNSYERFLEQNLETLVASYFPITHAKNTKYEIHYKGINFAEPLRTEEECRNEAKTFERALYVDLSLINNETGEVKKSKKTKGNLSKGIFFGNIPVMTSKGTFVINGTEKFVISQIVRAPGIYVLGKSHIKLNNKKKTTKGYICEMLPYRGTLINFWIDESNDKPVVKITMRNSLGDSAPTFPATQILKAFGISQDEIRRVFKDDIFILNTMYSEKYNRTNIVDDFEILGLRQQFNSGKLSSGLSQGSPVENKLKNLVIEYEKLIAEESILSNEYENEYSQYSIKHEQLSTQLKTGTKDNKEKIQEKIEKLKKVLTKTLDKTEALNTKIKFILDCIITEKAAKDIVTELAISIRSMETYSSSTANPISYQDIMVSHFMDPRRYDLSSAGRYRTVRKTRITERLYQRILSEPLITKSGKILLDQGTLIFKDEMDIIKKEISKNNLDLFGKINYISESKIIKKQDNTFESAFVYADNDEQDIAVPIIGLHANTSVEKSLTVLDFVSTISYTLNLPHGIGNYDDIDHVGNKRLRLIDEQLKSKLQVGMIRVEKYVKDKLASLLIATANDEQKAKLAARTTIKNVVNTKAFQLVIKAFFNSYQLTQFIDQQNPLSELSNKRRISAMGDGGISREDPNLDIRDVHYSQYGRICPIETPEGMNIGLIMSLASFTKIDENGFLVTPYHKVSKGKIQKQIEWLTSLREDEYIICESTTPHDDNGNISVDKAVCRFHSFQQLYDKNKIDYMDVSPRQIVSIAASAIPFLEHNDTTRALMGANMQRQAVPLIHPYAPIVGTGVEYKIAHDSGLCIVAPADGVVEYVDGIKIKIKSATKTSTHKLIKYRKSNQNTCVNQSPIVSVGEKVKAHQTLANGPAMYNGELALGRNPLVAFTTWNGYNIEDAIVVSDRLVRDDVYTSISIEEHSIQCLRTKNGDEEITRDIINISDDAKRYLDEDGIIMIGAEVREGDILVGKITPRGKSDFSPEEKLLQAIFGNKTKNFREASLKVPHGGEGIVAKIQRFSISNNDELDDDVIELVKIFIVQKRKIQIGDKMSGRHGNKGCISIVAPVADMPFMEDGTPIDICLSPLGVPSRMNLGQVLEINLGLSMRELGQQKMISSYFENSTKKACVAIFGVEFGLEPNKATSLYLSIVKYLKDNDISNQEQAHKKLSHNDMFLIIKNAGLDIEAINFKAQTPVFNGATLDNVVNILEEAGFSSKNRKDLGKFQLFDGKTGDAFKNPTTVGVMYMMKLDHMVDDKIHARSIGPYSKITQQPLGGKSQNGGQRFGEMEVWALEAYGAAYNLRELLTIKSDDVKGRNLTYSSIIKGKPIPKSGLPETFKLLTKQLQGLCLNMDAIYEDGKKVNLNSFSSVTDEDVTNDPNKISGSMASAVDFDRNNDDESDNY